MSVDKPFHRNHRGFAEVANSGYSSWAYVVDREYARSPEYYTEAFLLIQADLKAVFEYVEPADANLDTYSFRIHELLVRSCIEVEANFKAILRENLYSPKDRRGRERTESDWNMSDYQRIDRTHHLSSYAVTVPRWNGSGSIFRPFAPWKEGSPAAWYQEYNQVKHSRQDEFHHANLRNLLGAVTGLLVVLSSQFGREDFSSKGRSLGIDTDSYFPGETGIGDYFLIQFPDDWSEDEKYDFDWTALKTQGERFQKIDFNNT